MSGNSEATENTCSNPQPLGNVRNENRNPNNMRGKAIIEIILRDVTVIGSNVFSVRVGDMGLVSVQVPL